MLLGRFGRGSSEILELMWAGERGFLTQYLARLEEACSSELYSCFKCCGAYGKAAMIFFFRGDVGMGCRHAVCSKTDCGDVKAVEGAAHAGQDNSDRATK